MTWKTTSLFCVVLLGAATLSLRAWADADSDWKTCRTEIADRGAAEACTALIESGNVTGTDLAEAFYHRGQTYSYQSQTARALEDYDQAIKLNPNDAYYFYYRGIAYGDMGEYALAIKDYDRAIALKPAASSAASDYNNRAMAYLHLGQYARAISDFDLAIKLDPKDATPLYNRGVAKINHGDKADGEADIAKAKEIDPGIGD